MEEEQFEDEDEIHCMEDKGSAAFLTLAAYEESLLQEQESQQWDRDIVLQTGEQQRYNLRSNAKNVKENPTQRTVVQTESQNIRQRRPAADPVILKAPVQAEEEQGSQVWEMFFDGACSRETAGGRVVLVSPKQKSILLSFKLVFQVTNNIAKYKALLLGLNAAKTEELEA